MNARKLQRVVSASRKLERAKAEYMAALRAAHPDNTLQEIGDVVGLSRARIHQIIRG